jgi:hypothetical protein
MLGTSVSATVCEVVHARRDRFFHWFLGVDLSRIMGSYAILPAVVGSRDQTGPMDRAGSRRVVQFSDGSTAVEQVIDCDAPDVITYCVSDLTSVFQHLVREGRAQIKFRQAEDDVALVEWRSTFYGRNWPAGVLLRPLVLVFWRGYLRSALSKAKYRAEAELPGLSS